MGGFRAIPRVLVGAAAAAVLAFAAAIVWSRGFWPSPGVPGVMREHLLALVVATVSASLLHTATCVVALRRPPSLLFVIAVAAAARLVLLFGAPGPLLEGEPKRLRFEARLVNQGLHPYEFRPFELADPEAGGAPMPPEAMDRLARARAALSASNDGPRAEEVEDPHRRSRQTPLAHWIGALADRFKPHSDRGRAFFVLVADCAAAYFVVLALRAAKRPLGWVLVYAWCPVLLKELYTTMPVEAFVLPALAALVWCAGTGRGALAAVPAAVAAALRPAMLLLVPVVARRLRLGGVLLAVVLFALPALPFLAARHVPARAYAEGLVHDWRFCEYNSGFENAATGLLARAGWKAESTLVVAGVPILQPGDALAPVLAKLAGLLLLLGIATYLTIRIVPGRCVLRRDCDATLTELFVVLAAMLFLGPAAHPWHALWLLPILAVRPAFSWCLLPGILSLSYLTHLQGPHAADLALGGGRVSFRAIEYGAFALLWLLDVLWRPVLAPPREETPARVVVPVAPSEPDLGFTTFDAEGRPEATRNPPRRAPTF